MSTTCQKQDCPRFGLPMRWNTVRKLAVKGAPLDRTVEIKVFVCEQYGPRKTLHTHYTGPHDEQVTRLDMHGSYRYRDSETGEIVETAGPRGWKVSAAARKRISEATKKRWADPEKRARLIKGRFNRTN